MKKVIVFILALTMIFSISSVSFAADSYTEYFSKEREFVVTDNALDWSTYFYSNEETGYLYSRNVDTEEIKLIYAQNVTEHYLWKENIFCVVDGKNIVKITVTGQNPQTILTTNKDINQLYVNDDLVFYLMDNAIYRYHIDSKTTDCVVQDDNICFFYPYSNFVIEWNGEKKEVYRLDLRTRNNVPIITNEYTFINEININAFGAPTITVHGKSLPYNSYDDGDYYTKTGGPCSGHCHDSFGACTEGAACDTCMYITDGSAGTAMQCHAFACKVFKYIWGSYTEKEIQSPRPSINSEPAARSELQALPSGTMLRVITAGNYEHTIILAQVNYNGAIIYDANNDGTGIVQYKTFSFSEIASKYKSIKTIWRGNHSTGTSYLSDNNSHWYKCSTSSNCNNRGSIAEHSYISGSSRCYVCGRIRPELNSLVLVEQQ